MFCKHFLWLVTRRDAFRKCSVVYLRRAVWSTATTLMRGTALQHLNKGIHILHASETDPRRSLTLRLIQLLRKADRKRQRGWTVVEAASYPEGVAFVHGDSDHNDSIEPWNWQRVRDGSGPRIFPCRTFLQGCDGTEYRTRLLSSVFVQMVPKGSRCHPYIECSDQTLLVLACWGDQSKFILKTQKTGLIMYIPWFVPNVTIVSAIIHYVLISPAVLAF